MDKKEISGGAAKRKKSSKAKTKPKKSGTSTRKPSRTSHSKKPKKSGTKRIGMKSPTLEELKEEARRHGIHLSKDGKKKNKSELARAVRRVA